MFQNFTFPEEYDSAETKAYRISKAARGLADA
jgi:hypothetical protein